MVRGAVQCGMVCGFGTVCDIKCRYGRIARFDILQENIPVFDIVCWWYGMMVSCVGCFTRLNIRANLWSG